MISKARSVTDVISDGLFAILTAIAVVRALTHVMWRDELEVFMLAQGHASLFDLFRALDYTGHPGLWPTLVWLIAKAASDPFWMQVAHTVLAVAVSAIVYRWAPFSKPEKILLLASYFLFFEYFVISRSYVLLVLIGFAFVAIRQHRPDWTLAPWLLLGLLANVHLLGAIWSIALGAILAIEQVRRGPRLLAGGAVYLAMLALAVGTMAPAPDFGPWGRDFAFDLSRVGSRLAYGVGPFVPLNADAVRSAFAFLVSPDSATVPKFWNVNAVSDVVALSRANVEHPLRLVLVLAVPVAICWLVARSPLAVLQFVLAYVGIISFATIWDFAGDSRHHGVVFLAFIAAVWTARAQRSPNVLSSGLFVSLLAINAFAGLLTLASAAQPFSESRSAAAWIRQNNLADAFLIGSRDAQVSSVSGYLGRSIYYLECECSGTFVVWNDKRNSMISDAEFWRRLAIAANRAGQADAILIRYRPIAPAELASNPADLLLTELARFTGATTDENYWIYRLSMAAKTSQKK
jgi:hypothetical protein